jgi:hypothetical protein
MFRKTTPRGDRIDWPSVRDRTDLAKVATALLGPAPGRRGERGRRLWWRCPLGSHDDADPAGDRATSGWPARAVRVRPPGPHKDWGELHAAGFNLIRYVRHRILATPTPWEELARERWGDGSD